MTNSAGNLALHLEGNLREFVGRQLGGISYTRCRQQEFSSSGVSVDELTAAMNSLVDLVPGVISGLSDEVLQADYPEIVLGQRLSTVQFLIHLNGHLNYHLGQIDYLRRILTASGAIPLATL